MTQLDDDRLMIHPLDELGRQIFERAALLDLVAINARAALAGEADPHDVLVWCATLGHFSDHCGE